MIRRSRNLNYNYDVGPKGCFSGGLETPLGRNLGISLSTDKETFYVGVGVVSARRSTIPSHIPSGHKGMQGLIL